MTNPKSIAIIGRTQDVIHVKNVVDNLAVLKDNTCVLILEVGAINFDLLSEEEQETIIFAYSGLLNSLSFPVQIYTRSQKKDLSNYLVFLDSKIKTVNNQILKKRLLDYKNFVYRLVKEKNVLTKKFYLIISYKYFSPQVVPTKFNLFDLFSGKKNKPANSIPAEKIVERAKNHLIPKRDHLIRQLSRIGLPSRQLSSSEIVKLFHHIYNPDHPLKVISSQEYLTTLVSTSKKPGLS